MSSIDIMVRKLERLSKEALEVVSSSMCEEALNLISEGFAAGADPYGAPWNAPNNLQITGRIRSYTKGLVDGGGFSIHATDQKAIWHHDPQMRDTAPFHRKGTAPLEWKLPTRLQVPTKEKGLPPTWEERLREAAEEAIEALV